ncbi:hypothetical protein SPI_06822 [Niveomyces insectorum RCEF 264]|uniref:Uncharacterized protein n=1 Tax=Niveomyces insectorum RCEF 264 TaxID=1081102 RepID=A0A167QSX7_9HYPO|nr:hypothetical protein SPI_06822 [Niveomyces insectorum RCEF 264]
MSQWTKGKFKQRGPPPTLFPQASPAASKVSLHGFAAGKDGSGATGAAETQNGRRNNGMGTPITAGTPSSAGGTAVPGTAMPSLLTLQRTTSRLRQEVVGGGGGSGSSAEGALSRTNSAGMVDMAGDAGASGSTNAAVAAAAAAAGGGGGGAPPTTFALPRTLRNESTRATDRTDALWAEMQATLEEVELSASAGTRVFGPDHDQKLAALRQAQIALAQAWARSEAEEGGGDGDDVGKTADKDASNNNNNNNNNHTTNGSNNGTTAPGGGGKDELPGAAASSDSNAGGGGSSTAGAVTTGVGAGAAAGSATAGATRPSSFGVDHQFSTRMEEETQVDILLARKRREANDRYFERVSQGVLDVVAKLEDVAEAMRAVEQESKDIWGGGGGDDNESEHLGGKA